MILFFTHLTQTQIGELFGASSHQVGRWLVEVGLRMADKQTSRKAIEEGFVMTISTDFAPRGFPSWHKERTVPVLESHGHNRVGVRDEGRGEPLRELLLGVVPPAEAITVVRPHLIGFLHRHRCLQLLP
jgi:hypothetical protein